MAELVAGRGIMSGAVTADIPEDVTVVQSGDIGCLADVGTDHGYIPIYMIQQKIAKKAIAMDINRGPLQRAQEHIDEHQLGAYIQTRLSDGLASLKSGEAQVIVIAGMGGATMIHILAEGAEVIGPDTLLVLQPQSELKEFRQYLWERGFQILAEDMVKEDGKYYPMMKVRRRCQADEMEQESRGKTEDAGQGLCLQTECLEQGLCRQMEWRYGPLLLHQRHPVLREYLEWQLMQQREILEHLRRAEESVKQVEEADDGSVQSRKADDSSIQSKEADNAPSSLDAAAEDPGQSEQRELMGRRSRRKQEIQEEIGYLRQALAWYEEG